MPHKIYVAYIPVDEPEETSRAQISKVATKVFAAAIPAGDPPDVCLFHAQALTARSLEVLRQECQRYDNSTCVLLTPDSNQQALIAAYKLGIEEHIVLPIDDTLLAIKLRQLLKAKLSNQLETEKNQQMEGILTRIQQEESFAHHVYEEITGGDLKRARDYYWLQRSASGFCGDFLFDMRSPTGVRYIFMADAMGHGLAAALSIMPVIHVVKAMAHRSMPLSTIIHEVNRRLNAELPDDRFVTLTAIEVSPFSQKVSIVNAGLPALFVVLENNEIEECRSHCLPLGIMDGAQFSFKPYTYDLSSLKSLLMYTDGLIEQQNTLGETITKDGLRQALQNMLTDSQPWQTVSDLFNRHTGSEPLSDDVTFCAIDFSTLKIEDQTQSRGDTRIGEIAFSLEITGEFLGSVDAPAFVSKFLYAAGIEGKLAGKTFTTIAELYQNGLDHGVLNLDSALKNDIEGFADYMAQREQALKQLLQKDKLTLSLRYNAEGGITATIEDTGEGYDANAIKPDQVSFYGRGLALVRKLTESCQINDSGNHVTVEIKE